MENPLRTIGAINTGLLIARVQLGLYFVVQGASKLSVGIDKLVSSQSASIPSFVPGEIARAVLFMLPFVQIVAGAMLVLGLFTRFSAGATAFVLFCIATTQGILSDPIHAIFRHTMAFFGMAIVLMLVGGGDWTVHRPLERLLHAMRRENKRTLREPAHATGALAHSLEDDLDETFSTT